MRRLCKFLLLAGPALVALAFIVPPSAQAANVVIVDFSFRPERVEVDPGETVTWTNTDSTAHTVTARNGSFDSGRIYNGQSYSVRFTTPGSVPYICTLHDFHQGEVVVRGAASTTTTTAPTTTTTSPPAGGGTTAPPSTSTPGAVTPGRPGPTTTAPTTVSPSSPAGPGSSLGSPVSGVEVVGGGVVGEPPDRLPPLALIVAVFLLAAVATGPLVLDGRMVEACVVVAGVLTLANALIHLEQGLDVGYPEPVGTLFYVQAGSGAVLAGCLVGWRWRRQRVAVALGGVAFHGLSLGALALSRLGELFGFSEDGWEPSPETATAFATEVAALVLLLVVVVASRRRKSPAAWT